MIPLAALAASDIVGGGGVAHGGILTLQGRVKPSLKKFPKSAEPGRFSATNLSIVVSNKQHHVLEILTMDGWRRRLAEIMAGAEGRDLTTEEVREICLLYTSDAADEAYDV